MRLSLIMAMAALALSACAQKPREPQFESLTRELMLIDAEGKRYGTVQLDPIGGGKMLDVEGRVVGVITAPAK
jgi:hypothetical protein